MSDTGAVSPNIKGFTAPRYRLNSHHRYGGYKFMERYSFGRLRYAARHSRQKQFERIDAAWRRQYARIIVPISATASVLLATVSLIKERRAIRKVEMPLWWTLVITGFAIFAVVISGVLYTRSIDQKRAESERRIRIENDKRWCALLKPLDKAYNATTPATELGKQVADAIHALVLSFSCD